MTTRQAKSQSAKRSRGELRIQLWLTPEVQKWLRKECPGLSMPKAARFALEAMRMKSDVAVANKRLGWHVGGPATGYTYQEPKPIKEEEK